jgi:Uri superfamily endonuclease
VTLPSEPGTYALLCYSHRAELVPIGRLGRLQLRRGYFVYVGSALGPGGLRARLTHHLRPARKPHWHIDYLRAQTRLDRIWLIPGCDRREHQWAEVLKSNLNGTVPLPGFGSSDCDCESHLFFFRTRPSVKSFSAALRV